jgi:hypothetical protein
MKDEILEELWRVKDQINDETNRNTPALFKRLRLIKLNSSQRMVNRTASRKPQQA